MVKLTKIYTRGGDDGKTSLVGGQRVIKHDLRVQAYGAVDETNAAIGTARIHASPYVDEFLKKIQNDLFDLGADLANPKDTDQSSLRISRQQVERLEQNIDEINANLEELTSFVLPAGSPASAQLHLARTICRRAERVATNLAEVSTINSESVRYLNRLSDFLFVAARHENDLGQNEELWHPGANYT